MHPSLTLLALASLAMGCGVHDISSHVNRDAGTEVLCAPTGRSLVDTGVYIAPEACTSVTLYALDADAGNDAWILSVAWPMYGEYHVLELTNHTTGDVERKVLYTGDPEFTLYEGNYVLGGFQVAEGDNEIEYLVYNTTEPSPDVHTRNVVRQGTFTLHVTHTASTGN